VFLIQEYFEIQYLPIDFAGSTIDITDEDSTVGVGLLDLPSGWVSPEL